VSASRGESEQRAEALRRLAEASEDDVGRLLLRAYRHVTTAIAEELRERGFTDVRPSHGVVLAQLDPAGTKIVDLAQRADLTRQAAGTAVRELVAAGYVEVADDPADRRASVVLLTPHGVELCVAAVEILEERTTAWGAALGDPRLAGLADRLRRLLADPR
jgi:DNA-binding MarR family transcriptional regulator